MAELKKGSNGKYYVTTRTRESGVFLVKDRSSNVGSINVKLDIKFPKNLIGKHIRIMVDEVDMPGEK